ncbi:MAG: hypothetical protein CUN54_03110 [Phototrophicales bacterium]|nr:MAG: hypothetical protein CUN54_03110 [Phototrophicales bacterium]
MIRWVLLALNWNIATELFNIALFVFPASNNCGSNFFQHRDDSLMLNLMDAMRRLIMLIINPLRLISHWALL